LGLQGWSELKEEEKEFLGKKCKGYETTMDGMKAKVWVWEEIILCTELFDRRNRVTEVKASKLEVNVPIPADKFQVPPDISIK
jgi:hypothetical protein